MKFVVIDLRLVVVVVAAVARIAVDSGSLVEIGELVAVVDCLLGYFGYCLTVAVAVGLQSIVAMPPSR